MEDDRYTRITLRIPKELDQQLEAAAGSTGKSKNAEIIGRLQQSFEEDESGLSKEEILDITTRVIKLTEENERILASNADKIKSLEAKLGKIQESLLTPLDLERSLLNYSGALASLSVDSETTEPRPQTKKRPPKKQRPQGK